MYHNFSAAERIWTPQFKASDPNMHRYETGKDKSLDSNLWIKHQINVWLQTWQMGQKWMGEFFQGLQIRLNNE